MSAWNKGLTKETDGRVRKYAESGAITRKGKASTKRIYSLNSEDWKLNCINCNKEMIYTNRKSYIRAYKQKNKKCGSCRQIGIKPTEEARWKMGLAKIGTTRSQEVKDKIRKTLTGHKRYKENPGPNLGRKFSFEWRKNISNTLKERGIRPSYSPNYNPKSISIIEKLGKELGCKFQHAENGGEVRIGRFSVDGCDVDKKIIVEVDEKHHFNADGTYKQKDIERQNYLENLGYNVIRIKV